MIWRRRRILVAFALLAVASYVVCGIWGEGGRGFFSPDTLECRTQSELLFPLTHVPLYRSQFSYHRYALVEYLISEGYWSSVETPSPRWVPTFHWNRQWRDGTSNFHRAFGWRSHEWIEWTKQNPQIAAKSWPMVIDALRSPIEPDMARAEAVLFIARFSESMKDFEDGVSRLGKE